jgi:hypothetical protein
MAATGVVWAIVWALTRRPELSALLASAFTLLFHSAGHLYSGHVQGLIGPLVAAAGLPGSGIRVAIAILVVGGVLGFAIFRLHAFHTPITIFFNVGGASLLLMTVVTIGRHEWDLNRPPPAGEDSLSRAVLSGSIQPASAMPDVYYIILDGYGREDVLGDLYGFDNQPFLDALGDMGFQVNPAARSNYMQTALSLSSSLNASYLDGMLTPEERQGASRTPLSRLLLHNQVERVFAQAGYTTVGIESGYRPTELVDSDIYVSTHTGSATLIERLLIENSALAALQAWSGAPRDLRFPGYQLHRQRVLAEAASLPREVASIPGPKFVFAHFLVPHPPFVFDADGSPRQPSYPYVLLDGSAFPGDQRTYVASYRDQLVYTNSLILETLRALVAGRGQGAIIIVQGDHGPGSRLDWQSEEGTDLRERMGILLAIRLPPDSKRPLQSVNTPVNLFRAVFNDLLDSDLPLLPDRSYFSTWDHLYEFQAVPEADVAPR